MKEILSPVIVRNSINFLDNICFSETKDFEGNPFKLMMSLMLQNGNSEMRLASGRNEEKPLKKQPLIVWINGSGWRKCDKNLMVAEMEFLAEAGYAVAFITYRDSSLGHFPAQLIDVKSAIRFLRANEETYNIDGKRIGTIGRSAGGHLSSFCAMNLPGFDQGDNLDQSSMVQAAVDLFGPVNLTALYEDNQKKILDPKYRWHHALETHEGALLGGPEDTLYQRTFVASPINYINEKMSPIAIYHGDRDILVPWQQSEDFYNLLVKKGFKDSSYFYLLKNAGHGTKEFFQPSTKKTIVAFFDKYLK